MNEQGRYRVVLMVPVELDLWAVDEHTAAAAARDELRKYLPQSRSRPAPYLLEVVEEFRGVRRNG